MELIYFILGIFFIQYCIPALDGLCTWFLSWIEVKKAKQGEIVNQVNITMRQAVASAEGEPQKKIVGFYSSDDDYEEEEDDET